MGLLADIYSGSDSLKRKVKGLLADPLGTIEQKINQFGEDQQTAINNAQDATGFGGNRSVLMSPQQKQQASKALGDYAGSMGLAGLTVWHGSPHKFDKFDSGKIGTGEGAQAYGHGLYLAESPDVAKNYQAALGRPDSAGLTKAQDIAAWAKTQGVHGVEPADVLSQEIQRLEQYGKFGKKLNREDYENALRLVKTGQAPTNGALYKVDLPDEHISKMLDWDKPLSQQAPEVQALLPAVGNATRGKVYDWKKSLPMGDAYRQMVGDIGGEAKAAEALRQAGIPGIRYLDGGSRGTGSGSSNFVVFPGNEGLLNILERNGQPMNGLLAK